MKKFGKNNRAFYLVILLLMFTMLTGCGADEDQEVDDAIEVALTYLTSGDCQRAIDVLEEVGRHSKHYLYVKTLASSYACRAGYSTVSLFADDLGKIGTPSVLGSLTRFSGADEMDTPEESSFEDLQEAIDILLYAGGISSSKNPTADRRSIHFSVQEASGINIYLMYLTLAQIGKYLHFYGNADSDGVKGGGGFGNDCLVNYTTGGDADVALGALGGTCGGAGDSGSPYLGSEGNLNSARMCQGVILFNTLFNSMEAVLTSLVGSEFDDLATISLAFDVQKTLLIAADSDAADLVIQQGLSQCVSNYSTSTDLLELFFAFYFEVLLE